MTPMAAKVHFSYQKEFSSSKNQVEVHRYLSDVAASVSKNFPGVEHLNNVAPDTFEWTFEKFGYKNYEFQIKLTTLVKNSPPSKIEMHPVPKAGQGELTSTWHIDPATNGSKIRYNASLNLELPIPSLLKGLAEKIVASEFTKLFDRFIRHVDQALAKI